jgi:hypothetical protein
LNVPNSPPVACLNARSKLTFKHKIKVDRNARSTSYDIILGCDAMKDVRQWKNFNSTFSTVQTYLRSDSSKKLKLIASLMAFGHVCTFGIYFQTQQSTIEQKKNSLRNDASAKHSIKQEIFTNAYLLICHHKKRRNSMTYSTNIDSFSKAPLDS